MDVENIHSIAESELHLENSLPKVEEKNLGSSVIDCVFYRAHSCLAPSQTYMMCKNCPHCSNLPDLAARDIFQRIIGTAILLLNTLGFSFGGNSVGRVSGDIDDIV